MAFDKYDRLERINIAIKQLNEFDMSFSSTRRNFKMPPVEGDPPIESEADTLAAERMRNANRGGSIPTGYSETERQRAIQKYRSAAQERAESEKQSFKDIVDKGQLVLDTLTLIGSGVPGLNVISAKAQGISSLIDVAQGQYGEAGLRGLQAGASIIPGARLMTTLATKAKAASLPGRFLPGATRAVRQIPTGAKKYIPALSPMSWKPAIKRAGGMPFEVSGKSYPIQFGLRLPTFHAMSKDDADQEK